MNVSFDSPDLEGWMQDLVSAETRIVPAVRGAVTAAGKAVAKDAAKRFEAQRVGPFLPNYSKSITAEVVEVPKGAAAEVGPVTSRSQGKFGPGIEYGSSHTPPMPHLNPALVEAATPFETAVGVAGERALNR